MIANKAEGEHEHNTDQEDGADSNLALSGDPELEYHLDGDHHQVAVTEATKTGQRDGKILRRFAALHAAVHPCRSIVWQAGLRHAKCTIDDDTGGIENPTGCDPTVYKPASDSVGFEKLEIA